MVVISENQAKNVGERLAGVLTALVCFKLHAYRCPFQGDIYCIYIYKQMNELRRTKDDWLASRTHLKQRQIVRFFFSFSIVPR